MLRAEFEKLDADGIDHLVNNEIPEGQHLEYKEILPDSKDGKKNILGEMASFANTSGGTIIFGLKDKVGPDGKKTGIPEVVGLGLTNSDEVILKLENIIRDGLTPRLQGHRIKVIDYPEKGYLYAVFVPRSWSAPHMIGEANKQFYSRTSAGKYPLDVYQLRDAFIAQASFLERASTFRLDRIAKIIGGETPLPLSKGPKAVIHLVPYSYVEPSFQIDIGRIDDIRLNIIQEPTQYLSWANSYNFDGIATLRHAGKADEYPGSRQVFRKGAIEFVEDCAMVTRPGEILGIDFEVKLFRWLGSCIEFLGTCDARPPYAFLLSILDAGGYRMRPLKEDLDRDFWQDHENFSICQDDLLCHEIVLDDVKADIPKMVRPVIDSIWQASGYQRSLNYNQDGAWIDRRKK
jgi:hypothetical protein